MNYYNFIYTMTKLIILANMLFNSNKGGIEFMIFVWTGNWIFLVKFV